MSISTYSYTGTKPSGQRVFNFSGDDRATLLKDKFKNTVNCLPVFIHHKDNVQAFSFFCTSYRRQEDSEENILAGQSQRLAEIQVLYTISAEVSDAQQNHVTM